MKRRQPILPVLLVCWAAATQVAAQTQALSLQEAVSLALQNNPEIKVSNFGVSKSIQEKTIARSLYLPNVNVGAQMAHFFQLTPFFGIGGNSADGKVGYGRFGGNDQAAAFVMASQPLFNASISPSLKLAKLRTQESNAALEGKKTDIVALVKQSYYQQLLLREEKRLLQERIRRNQVALEDARSLFSKGKALRVDTLRAYTSWKNLQPDLAKLTYQAETNDLRLKALLGLPSTQQLALTDSLKVIGERSIPAEQEVYEIAKLNRADLQMQSLQEKIYAQQAKLANAPARPSVSLIGQYQVQTQTNEFNYSNAYYPSSSFVGLQVAVPVFNGFRNEARAKQAVISQQQATTQLRNDEEQLHAVVHQAVSNCLESKDRMDITESVKETAKLSYELTQYRYASGVSLRLELMDAELAYSYAQSNYLEAVYDYLSARVTLFQVMGKTE